MFNDEEYKSPHVMMEEPPGTGETSLLELLRESDRSQGTVCVTHCVPAQICRFGLKPSPVHLLCLILTVYSLSFTEWNSWRISGFAEKPPSPTLLNHKGWELLWDASRHHWWHARECAPQANWQDPCCLFYSFLGPPFGKCSIECQHLGGGPCLLLDFPMHPRPMAY